MLDWNDLQYVIALQEAGTMKRAAELLKTDPTTVSRHIKRLSKSLGVSLFVMQKGGKWIMTPEGENLFNLASEFNQRIETIKLFGLTAGAQRTVRITSIEFLLVNYLATDLATAAQRFPKTNIELVGSDKRLSLAYGEADIALRFGRPQEGNLIASKIAEVTFQIWSPEGFDGNEWVGLHSDLDWTPEMRYARAFFNRPPIVRVTSYSAARNAADSLQVATVGPSSVMAFSETLVPYTKTGPMTRDVWSVIHESRRHDQHLAQVRDWTREAVLNRQKLVRQHLQKRISATLN